MPFTCLLPVRLLLHYFTLPVPLLLFTCYIFTTDSPFLPDSLPFLLLHQVTIRFLLVLQRQFILYFSNSSYLSRILKSMSSLFLLPNLSNFVSVTPFTCFLPVLFYLSFLRFHNFFDLLYTLNTSASSLIYITTRKVTFYLYYFCLFNLQLLQIYLYTLQSVI